MHLADQLTNFKINHKKPLVEEINRLVHLRLALKNVGIDKTDAEMIALLKGAMTSPWRIYLAMWVNNGSTFDDIFSKILSHEKEVNNSSSQSLSSIDNGLVVHTLHESARFVRCKSTDHPVELCTRKICLHCKQNGKHGVGHDKSECYMLKRSNNDSSHSHHHSFNTKKFKFEYINK
jgi:hypothetical protein